MSLITLCTKPSLAATAGGIVKWYDGFLPIAVFTRLKISEIHDQSNGRRCSAPGRLRTA